MILSLVEEKLSAVDIFSDLHEMHRKFELLYEGPPRRIPKEINELRIKQLREEIQEYEDAPNMSKQLDALIDLIVFAAGTIQLMGCGGWRAREAWRRVHAANMQKERVIDPKTGPRGSSFDLRKPDGWIAPDHTDLVRPV